MPKKRKSPLCKCGHDLHEGACAYGTGTLFGPCACERRMGKVTFGIADEKYAALDLLQTKLRLIASELGKLADIVAEARNGERREKVSIKRVRASAPESKASSVPRGELAVLNAIKQAKGGATRPMITVVTGYKRSTRDAYVQRLREKGMVNESGGRLFATAEGMSVPGFVQLPTGKELLHHYVETLPEGEAAILESVSVVYPMPISRESIIGYARSSRDAYIARLVRRELLESVGRGEIRMSRHLSEDTERVRPQT